MDPSHQHPAGLGLEQVYRLVGIEPPTLDRADVEALTGVGHDRSVPWWRAMGFPEIAAGEIAFGPEDAAIVAQLDEYIAAGAMTDDDVLRLARLTGASFSRLVEAQLAVMPGIEELIGRAGMGGEVTDPVIGPEPELLEFVEHTMNYVWRRHLLAALVRHLSVDDAETSQAVGFADLSGFSKVTKNADSEAITEIVDTFETVAFDVVSAHEARVVKLIGDEVLFVADDLDTAVDIALDVIERLAPIESVPRVHCGVAFGPTVTVGGDVFGPTVNLASRLTNLARPGSVAIARDGGTHFLDRDDLDVRSPVRSYDLKGIGRSRIIAIRPPHDDAS